MRSRSDFANGYTREIVAFHELDQIRALLPWIAVAILLGTVHLEMIAQNWTVKLLIQPAQLEQIVLE